MMVLLAIECSLSGGDSHRWRGQSQVVGTLKPYLPLKKFKLLALSGGRDSKTFGMPRHKSSPSHHFTHAHAQQVTWWNFDYLILYRKDCFPNTVK